MPIAPLTNFNNTVVLGSVVFAIVLAVPLFFALRLGVVRYRATIGERVRQSRFYKAVMASKAYNVYEMFRPRPLRYLTPGTRHHASRASAGVPSERYSDC